MKLSTWQKKRQGLKNMLLACLLIKHFLADFPLQFEWIVTGKAETGFKWIAPLLFHVWIHAFLTCFILLFFVSVELAAILSLCEGATHFIIDRLKAHPTIGGRFKFPTKAFWNALGFDQLLHALCYVAIAVYINGGHN